jgi:hypothetical protein
VLPQSGGILDQDEGLMRLIETCLYAQQLATKKLAEYTRADMDYVDRLEGRLSAQRAKA